MKCCENCKNAVYDSVPYGSTSADYLSGCRYEDEVTEDEAENNVECHKWEEEESTSVFTADNEL